MIAIPTWLAAADLAVFQRINGAGLPWLDPFFRMLSSHEFGLCALAIAGALLALGGGHRNVAGVLLLIAAVGAADLLGARLIKPWIARVRPCYALPPGTFRFIGMAANVGSMPSLHAANSFAAAGVILAERRRLAAPAYLVASLVALSRVYLGVHWPSDVVAGAVMGSGVALALVLFGRAAGRRLRTP